MSRFSGQFLDIFSVGLKLSRNLDKSRNSGRIGHSGITKICLYMPSNGWVWQNYAKLWMGRAKLCLRMCWYGQEMQCYCHTRAPSWISAKLKILQVPACKMEPRSGMIIGLKSTHPTTHPHRITWNLDILPWIKEGGIEGPLGMYEGCLEEVNK